HRIRHRLEDGAGQRSEGMDQTGSWLRSRRCSFESITSTDRTSSPSRGSHKRHRLLALVPRTADMLSSRKFSLRDGNLHASPNRRGTQMPRVRLRITGSDDDARAMMNLLQSLDGIEHVEEVADLMPRMDDEDSSSAGLSDDEGPGVHEVE